MSAPTLLISAGEPSGDRHAAHFLRAFSERNPGTLAFGLGGPELRAAGLEPVARMEDLAVVGLTEVLSRLPVAFRSLARLAEAARRRRPDLVVLVDFPDFNLRLASRVKRLGLRVLYYITPQVWAWREGRVKSLARDVDRLAVVFPFEVEFFARHGLAAEFVGHPLLEQMAHAGDPGFRERHGFDAARPLVALLPGSREGEVRRHWPLLLAAAAALRAQRPGVQFVAARAPGLPDGLLESPAGLGIRVLQGEEHAVLGNADAAAVAAGTATLQALLAGCPMVVFYRASGLTYALMKRAVRVQHVALANLIGGPGTARELLQDQATPGALAAELDRLLGDPGARPRMAAAAVEVRRTLAGGPASVGAARAAEELLCRAR